MSLIQGSFTQPDRLSYDPHHGLCIWMPVGTKFIPHHRASLKELKPYLNPDIKLRRSGNSFCDRQPDKDLPRMPAAWWMAQALHYGHPLITDIDKTKQTLKERFYNCALKQCLHLAKAEAQLKDKYMREQTQKRRVARQQVAHAAQAAQESIIHQDAETHVDEPTEECSNSSASSDAEVDEEPSDASDSDSNSDKESCSYESDDDDDDHDILDPHESVHKNQSEDPELQSRPLTKTSGSADSTALSDSVPDGANVAAHAKSMLTPQLQAQNNPTSIIVTSSNGEGDHSGKVLQRPNLGSHPQVRTQFSAPQPTLQLSNSNGRRKKKKICGVTQKNTPILYTSLAGTDLPPNEESTSNVENMAFPSKPALPPSYGPGISKRPQKDPYHTIPASTTNSTDRSKGGLFDGYLSLTKLRSGKATFVTPKKKQQMLVKEERATPEASLVGPLRPSEKRRRDLDSFNLSRAKRQKKDGMAWSSVVGQERRPIRFDSFNIRHVHSPNPFKDIEDGSSVSSQSLESPSPIPDGRQPLAETGREEVVELDPKDFTEIDPQVLIEIDQTDLENRETHMTRSGNLTSSTNMQDRRDTTSTARGSNRHRRQTTAEGGEQIEANRGKETAVSQPVENDLALPETPIFGDRRHSRSNQCLHDVRGAHSAKSTDQPATPTAHQFHGSAAAIRLQNQLNREGRRREYSLQTLDFKTFQSNNQGPSDHSPSDHSPITSMRRSSNRRDRETIPPPGEPRTENTVKKSPRIWVEIPTRRSREPEHQSSTPAQPAHPQTPSNKHRDSLGASPNDPTRPQHPKTPLRLNAKPSTPHSRNFVRTPSKPQPTSGADKEVSFADHPHNRHGGLSFRQLPIRQAGPPAPYDIGRSPTTGQPLKSILKNSPLAKKTHNTPVQHQNLTWVQRRFGPAYPYSSQE